MKRSKVQIISDLSGMEREGELKHWFLLMKDSNGKKSYVRCYYTSWYEGTPIGIVDKGELDVEARGKSDNNG